MPHWASVHYRFTGEREYVQELHTRIQQLHQRPTSLLPNGFGKLWLGNVVADLRGYVPSGCEALNREIQQTYCAYNCRGEIVEYELMEEEERPNSLTLCLNTLEAWCLQRGFMQAIQAAYPSLHIYYIAEEHGYSYYVTNDKTGKYFPDRYFLDSRCGETGYYNSLQDLVTDIETLVGQPVAPTLEALNNALATYNTKQGNGECYRVHAFVLEE